MAEASEDDDTVGNIISQASPEITSKMMRNYRNKTRTSGASHCSSIRK